MKPIDCFYTPPVVVCKMIRHVCSETPTHIADFSFGDGRLLKAAQSRWPHATLLGVDISQEAVNTLSQREPQWDIAQCDFMDEQGRASCSWLLEKIGKISLILLNPPFSCRGGARHHIKFEGEQIGCSLAMAFVLTAVSFLCENGELIAVLPAGVVQSARDQVAWDKLRQVGRVEVVDANDYNAFEGCTPRTIIIRFTRGKPTQLPHRAAEVGQPVGTAEGDKVYLYRGKLSMNVASAYVTASGTPLVHSTELQDGTVELTKRFTLRHGDRICGPVVLLHRVGKPKLKKLCLHTNTTEFLISDCIIAMQCQSVESAVDLHAKLIEEWGAVESRYGGTCARYITLEAVMQICSLLGFKPIIGLLPQSEQDHLQQC